jgi:uncharacterized membrane protein YhaH (DUF805 family)
MVRPKAHPFSPNALLCLLLSPVGAIGRAGFAGGGVLLALFALATDDAIRRLLDDPGLSGFVFALVVAWSAGCLSRKRLHDIGWSGIAIAIFLAVYILAVLGAPFLPAMPGRAVIGLLLVAGPAWGWTLWLAATPGSTRPHAVAKSSRLPAVAA